MRNVRAMLGLGLTLGLGWMAAGAAADVMVLVHGYRSDAGTWERSGVNQVLAANGWPRAGVLLPTLAGVQLLAPQPTTGSADRAYAVELPSEAPIPVQTSLLRQVLADLALREPGQPVVLVGHSAGGVVARAALVANAAAGVSAPQVRALVTIASPHLGTGRALQGLNVIDTPFPFSILEVMRVGGSNYDSLERSYGLLTDLVPAAPGSFLYGLNLQPHPAIRYVSVVRGDGYTFPGDRWVPGYSQDLNQVPALQGRAQLVAVASGHGLTPADGQAVADAVARAAVLMP